ncbi:MAG: ubiquitin-like domain-containing protein [Micrococcales bacterium]|nr:ubiquitin-like domain-containing protein [Micrococcales bacterium]
MLRRPVSRRRLVSWSAKIGVTLVAGLVLTGFAATHKTLTLTVDGQSTPVTSFGSSVASVLASEGVAISAHDVVVPALSEAVPRGGEIVVHTASAINVTIDGENRTVWTTAPTVDEALAELGVRAAESQLSVSRSTSVDRLNGVVSVSTPKVMAVMVDGIELEANTNAATVSQTLTEMGVVLGPDDVVSPPLDAATQLGQTITVDRAVVTNGSQIVTIPFEKVTQDDPDLEKGKTKVLQDGVAGERIITYVSTTAGTNELERTIVCDTLVRAPVDEITAVGTKPPPPPKPKVTVPKVNLKVDPGSNQGIAKAMAAGSYGWGDDQFACLVSLWQRESGWNHTAANGGSGAYGIPQAYPGSKMASAGADWQTNPTTQISWGLGYIKGRYGNPCAAWGYFQSHNSY